MLESFGVLREIGLLLLLYYKLQQVDKLWSPLRRGSCCRLVSFLELYYFGAVSMLRSAMRSVS